MLCPTCGFLNQSQRTTCLKCGRPLKADVGHKSGNNIPAPSPVRPHPEQNQATGKRQGIGGTTTDEIVNKMRLDYSFSHGDVTQKVIQKMLELVTESLKSGCDMGVLATEAAELIHKQFGVREVAIGLRSTHDGLYRYKVMVGIRGEAERAMRNCAYRASDFSDDSKYKGSSISKYTKLYLAEDMPFTDEERTTYSRPILLDTPRKSWMESMEGDYLNTTIFGKNGEFIGWIELSGLRTGMLPDANTVKWVELIGQVIGAALTAQGTKAHLPDISLPGDR